MNKVGRGVAIFLSKRALRMMGVPKEVLPPPGIPKKARKSLSKKLAKPAALTLASGTLLFASNDGKRRNQLASKLHDFSQRLASDSQPTSSASKNGHHASRNGSSRNGSSRNGSSRNGSSQNGSGPTKSELYELAKKKDVPGRSNMSKEELQKAVQKG